MRLPVLSLFLVTAVLIGETQTTFAQFAAETYPWCAVYGNRGNNARSCYYTSWEQCMTTMSGIGGLCIPSPYFHARPAPPVYASGKRRRIH
jgi:hypothetical protein